MVAARYPVTGKNNDKEVDVMRYLEAAAVVFGVLLGMVAFAPASEAAGDADQGKAVFKKCGACHTLEPGKNKVGPSLAGLFGRAAGAADGYRYSEDMKAAGEAGLVWSEETLTGYIKKDGAKGPKTYIGELVGKKKAKIKMSFPGLSKDEDIANLIAYLAASDPAGN